LLLLASACPAFAAAVAAMTAAAAANLGISFAEQFRGDPLTELRELSGDYESPSQKRVLCTDM